MRLQTYQRMCCVALHITCRYPPLRALCAFGSPRLSFWLERRPTFPGTGRGSLPAANRARGPEAPRLRNPAQVERHCVQPGRMSLEADLGSIKVDGLFLTQGCYHWREGVDVREPVFAPTKGADSVQQLAAQRLSGEAAPPVMASEFRAGRGRSRSRSPCRELPAEVSPGAASSAATAEALGAAHAETALSRYGQPGPTREAVPPWRGPHSANPQACVGSGSMQRGAAGEAEPPEYEAMPPPRVPHSRRPTASPQQGARVAGDVRVANPTPTPAELSDSDILRALESMPRIGVELPTDNPWINHEGRRQLFDHSPFRVPEDIPMPQLVEEALTSPNGLERRLRYLDTQCCCPRTCGRQFVSWLSCCRSRG